MSKSWSQRSQLIESFKVMDLLKHAHALADQGRSIIHLGAGEPDFGAAPQVIEEAKRLLDTTPMTYTPAAGISALREKIAAFHQQRYGQKIAADNVLVTAGASAALQLTFALLANRDQKILMADPGYPCNRQFLRIVEAQAVSIPVDHEQNYQLTAELVEQHWDEQTAGVLIASPANPTGAVIDPQELANIAATVSRLGGTLVVDEIYHGLTYGAETPSAFSIDTNCIVINSFSKYFGMTGWRLGWLVADASAVAEMEKMAQNLYISPTTLSQYAALRAFEPDAIELFELRREELQQRRDRLLEGLKRIGFKVPRTPAGAFYIYADASDLCDYSFSWCWELLERAGVVATPGADFGEYQAHKFVRFAYTTSLANIDEALNRIEQFVSDTRG
ncbi:aminotransferase class I/II-fold pyridoxal phosphate-dependent enzyme [Marinobacterium sp. xm-d-564]|uniref:aminotransferase class I/II-fold pyridoxal phosphate-dependent enzyme n=1 Tax=Marinobacterium sp. xm-d-564 TaxID=2497742 RepID=UPI001569025C|nr:aminotransferase class I/II-fold pyridoxal phosphate-dependent enzyme [Marinobacterium sp. xm-d-564]NRP60327.1 Aspartate aminotransferase [Marinobacterium sp. xm-d-564]